MFLVVLSNSNNSLLLGIAIKRKLHFFVFLSAQNFKEECLELQTNEHLEFHN